MSVLKKLAFGAVGAVLLGGVVFSGGVPAPAYAGAEAEPAVGVETEATPVTDAWTKIEGEQLGMAMGELMDDEKYAKYREAAQNRLGIDEDGGEWFMTCLMGLAGHPNFSTARVREAFEMCTRTMPSQR